MKEIPLTKGQSVIVDDVDYEELSKFKWFANGHSGRYYAARKRNAADGGDGQQIKMHRLIAGAREGECVDHVNGNSLDNRRANLRICTAAQNVYNRRVCKTNKLGVKGVFPCSERRMTVQGYKRPYRAKLKVGGVVHLDRTFHTIEQAKAAYDAAALQHQGEFSRS